MTAKSAGLRLWELTRTWGSGLIVSPQGRSNSKLKESSTVMRSPVEVGSLLITVIIMTAGCPTRNRRGWTSTWGAIVIGRDGASARGPGCRVRLSCAPLVLRACRLCAGRLGESAPGDANPDGPLAATGTHPAAGGSSSQLAENGAHDRRAAGDGSRARCAQGSPGLSSRRPGPRRRRALLWVPGPETPPTAILSPPWSSRGSPRAQARPYIRSGRGRHLPVVAVVTRSSLPFRPAHSLRRIHMVPVPGR